MIIFKCIFTIYIFTITNHLELTLLQFSRFIHFYYCIKQCIYTSEKWMSFRLRMNNNNTNENNYNSNINDNNYIYNHKYNYIKNKHTFFVTLTNIILLHISLLYIFPVCKKWCSVFFCYLHCYTNLHIHHLLYLNWQFNA